MKEDDRRRSKRGEAIRSNSKHENIIGKLKEVLPTDADDNNVPDDLRLDLNELLERGLITPTGVNPDDGTAYLESAHGINRDGAWTVDKSLEPKYRRGEYIFCPREFTPYMRAIFSGRSPRGQKIVWREMLWLYGKTRTVLIEVKSKRFNKTWLGVFNAGDVSIGVEKLLYLICSDVGNGMSYDFATSGIGEFELSFIGAFSGLEACLDYRDYVMNIRLDQGWGSYNRKEWEAKTVKRKISIEIDHRLAKKLLQVTTAKGMRIKDLLSRLVVRWLKKNQDNPEKQDKS